MGFIQRAVREIRSSVIDDRVRHRLQFLWAFRILGLVAAFMTVVNVVTGKRALMVSTLLFALACLADALLLRSGSSGLKIACVLFAVQLYALFLFFIVSGTPEGFSMIWICLLPTGGLLLYGRERGSAMSAAMLGILVFFLWTPFGRSLLQYRYTDAFLMRFPMLYIAFFAVSYFFETVRVLTQEQLVEAEAKYQCLYLHDALTGVYNRYGFDETLNSALQNRSAAGLALLILDLDHFKQINDRYGHLVGDEVLRAAAHAMQKTLGARGTLCRWGGEEFAVLTPQAVGAAQLAEELRCAVGEAAVTLESGERVQITASIGAVYTQSSRRCGAAELARCADVCLYEAKAAGRNRIVCRALL